MSPQEGKKQPDPPAVHDWTRWRPQGHPIWLVTLLVTFALWVAFLVWMGR
ncbi:MAG: hypothetical protein KDA92_02225 [Planctomycetales bacterium]|nr:hypothetical protein [Planctomycetales bacterium]MCA9166740.1 hypothetical protein [Planctomycetales bacterium]